jgi:hypothetical protein
VIAREDLIARNAKIAKDRRHWGKKNLPLINTDDTDLSGIK